jgi:hypothetical protein
MCPLRQVANCRCGRSLKDDDGAGQECQLSNIGQFDRGKVQFNVLLHCSLVWALQRLQDVLSWQFPEDCSLPNVTNTSEFRG